MLSLTEKRKLSQRAVSSSLARGTTHESRLTTRAPQRQRGCACGGDCPKCQAEAMAGHEPGLLLSRVMGADGPGPTTTTPVIREESHPPGQPMDPSARGFMESRFGHDFSKVRIHADAAANRTSDTMGARAYASGDQIVFGTGQYQPDSHEGKILLSHELVHVLQRRGASDPGREMMTPYAHPAEVEARSLSESVIGGSPSSPIQTRVALNPQTVSMQMDPWSCSAFALLCLTLTEDPPAAAACWAFFAKHCGGVSAAADQPSAGNAMASAGAAGKPPAGDAFESAG